MGRRFRIPWLLNLVIVDQPAEVRDLAAEPRLDRDFRIRLGRLFNWSITELIRRWLGFDGHFLPAMARRSATRPTAKKSPERRLDPSRNEPLWDEAERGER